MSEAEDASVDLASCTSVLVSLPRGAAERIESFLAAHVIPCRIQPIADEDGSEWEVLIRPEDLPADPPAAPEAPVMNVSPDATVPPTEEPAVRGDMSPAVLCELTWNEAWRLARRLTDAGIPAAVMAAEEPDRDRPMAARVVPVGVRPEDLERARAHLAPNDAGP